MPMSLRTLALVLGAGLLAACGPSNGERECAGGATDTQSDPLNCGSCGVACSDGFACIDGACLAGECRPGTEESCYDGIASTRDIGPCKGGTRTCDDTGRWAPCLGQVVPQGEDGARCTDGVDNNCNGAIDENEDRDGDGLTTCGGDCCDSTECGKPELVNLGSFDAPGNNFDDDCNGMVDDTLLLCDQGLASNTTNALDFAKAIDICQTSTEQDSKWGVISGSLSRTNGMGTPDPRGHAVRPRFGTGLLPQGGVSLAILSTGAAAGKGDQNPAYTSFAGYTHVGDQACPTFLGSTASGRSCAPYPADFLGANNGVLPNAPGCEPPSTATLANDPVMLTLRIRVPSNAKSFKLSSNFFSAEFPEYTCSPFNDFFVVLLDSTYAGTPANPTDKNLAFYLPPGSADQVPVGVNLAFGNTGLFTQCVNGETGCSTSEPGSIATCTSTAHLTGTGFDDPSPGDCATSSLVGGATGWLVTSGNVTPGEIITLRIAIWDTSDHILDSLAVIDGFQWSIDVAQPGTVIFKDKPVLDALPRADVVSATVAR